MTRLYVALFMTAIAATSGCKTGTKSNSSTKDSIHENWWDAAAEACLFNDKQAFMVRKLADKSGKYRPRPTSRIMQFHVRELTHKASGIKFYDYSTFNDEDDGGNTVGWIETGYRQGRKILSEICDGGLCKCKVESIDQVAQSSEEDVWWDATDGECLFNDGSAFTKKTLADTSGPFKPHPSSGIKQYHARELTHNQSGRKFKEYSTFDDNDDGGNTMGWIEDATNGKVVVEIGDSGLGNCKLAR